MRVWWHRTSWRALCRQSIDSFEKSRVSHSEQAKSSQDMPDQHFYIPVWRVDGPAADSGFSRIGLFFPQALTPTHQLSENRRVNGSLHQSFSSNKRSTIRNDQWSKLHLCGMHSHFVAIAINTNVNSLVLNWYISLPTSANLFLEKRRNLRAFAPRWERAPLMSNLYKNYYNTT